ncbi:hypothetical protein BC936DRAFT_142590 [Jimgerdemannia flammicorona]|uniref:RING-type domain-containing protein n=1 Tax=Jimgerdemannia flammicorona TaxID=994334 RepID=A0A433DEZ1_9FUNG|nr:hypothetical protein BC936DRAFT_142590 [Jimgerdemannia flammicorona]
MFQTEYIVCGICPFNDMYILLAYLVDELEEEEDTNDPNEQKRKLAKRPELRIIDSYNEEVSNDVLSLHGYSHYQANDYMFDYLPTEDMFYVVSPKDLVAAKPRDIDDHIQWLLERTRYEEALQAAQEALPWGGSKRYNVGELGQKYLSWLVEKGQFAKAAETCPKVLNSDAQLWESWVFRFVELRELQAITPYIPTKEPRLSNTVYEIVLAWFLMNDHKTLLTTIKTWPPKLYDVQNIIVAVEDALSKDKDEEILLECLAELYLHDHQVAKAIEYNLRLRRPNVFDLIRTHNMFAAVKDKAMLLMEFDEYLLKKEREKEKETKITSELEEEKEQDESKKVAIGEKEWKSEKEIEAQKEKEREAQKEREKDARRATGMPAVQLLAKNTEAILPDRVVPQLRRNRRFLHTYLDALFDEDPHLGQDFHDLQVELYAEFDYPKLQEFLRASNYYSLEKAYKICEQRELVPEMVFMLGRMGDNKRALMLIIEKLRDVKRAIEFAQEQDDNVLWDDLLMYSRDKPPFIKGLLENVGTNIDPIRVIKTVPDDLEIPGLKQSLIKILQDYNLQMSLREGCQKILVSDSVQLADRMHRNQKRGISCSDDMTCAKCQNPVFDEENAKTTILFFCRHIFHEDCFFDNNVPLIPEQLTAATMSAKVNHATFLRSARVMKCPICQEHDEKGSGLIGRKMERRLPARIASPRSPSIRSFGSTKGAPSFSGSGRMDVLDDDIPPIVPLRIDR